MNESRFINPSSGDGTDAPQSYQGKDPVVLENHPRWGLRIVEKIGKKGNKFDGAPKNQTKQCAGCLNLRAVISTTKTGYEVSPEKLNHIVGICTWSTIWKIVWQSDKPRKCTLVPSYAGDII